MYNISRSKTGSVVLKCKVCSHSERVNEFDDRQGSRRTQAAQAMLRHTLTDHGRERGQADVQSARVVGLTGDYDIRREVNSARAFCGLQHYPEASGQATPVNA
jgi:hypothetical protein